MSESRNRQTRLQTNPSSMKVVLMTIMMEMRKRRRWLWLPWYGDGLSGKDEESSHDEDNDEEDGNYVEL